MVEVQWSLQAIADVDVEDGIEGLVERIDDGWRRILSGHRYQEYQGCREHFHDFRFVRNSPRA